MSDMTLNDTRREINEIDDAMAALFARRMAAAERIAAVKAATGAPVRDVAREAAVIARHTEALDDPSLAEDYATFQQGLMAVSRARQQRILADRDDYIPAWLKEYGVDFAPGGSERAGEYFELHRRVCIVTDDGVPPEYAVRVARQCDHAVTVTLPQGEASKTLANVSTVCRRMLMSGFTRGDCVVAVGGGMVCDLAGLAAALYMRGVTLYTVPTTLLAQSDAAIGGKTAVDLDGVKNILGVFRAPARVLVDTDLLNTLPPRHIANGLAEIIKMSLTSDKDLFERIEREDISALMPTLVLRSLRNKMRVVAADEREVGERKILNFGHTVGHGIEAASGRRLHGECVAVGMLPFCSEAVRERLVPVLKKAGLPVTAEVDAAAVFDAMTHDKKGASDGVDAVFVDQIGRASVRRITWDALRKMI